MELKLRAESVLTSFYSYGDVPDYKQAELLRKLAKPAENTAPDIGGAVQAIHAVSTNDGKQVIAIKLSYPSWYQKTFVY